MPLATFSADLWEAKYRFQVGELEEATARKEGPFTMNQLHIRLQIAAKHARSSAEELRDRQAKFDAQEHGYVDNAIRLQQQEWAFIHNCGSSGTIRKLLDQNVADLEFCNRQRENMKRGQAEWRECFIQGNVNELKEKMSIGNAEWGQTEERDDCWTKQMKKEKREMVAWTKQMKKEKRVGSPPGVETRLMKKARSS